MDNERADEPFDALVLAGGRATRLGGADKPGLDVGGRSLLEHVLAAVAAARRVVLVGPPRELPDSVVQRRESPPGGGPVAALAAGLADTSAAIVVVLAADLPAIAPAVAPLLRAVPADGRAVLVDASGRANQLAAAWARPALVAALARLGPPSGASMRALAQGVMTVEVPDPDGWGRDCDTWADLERARTLRTCGG